jgi:uncharacterized protein
MRIAISGSSGLTGSAVSEMFRKQPGNLVIPLERENLYGKTEDLAKILSGVNVIIHLAGAPIQQRWTKKNKELIYNSRIETTRNIVKAIEMMERKPEVFICASAATIYPEKGEHTERSKAIADSFLGVVARDWEAESSKASIFCRTIQLRISMVLSDKAGALKTMLPPFRLGVGGKVGSGNQMVSWVHIEDFVRITDFVIGEKTINGPVNVVSPGRVTNSEFSKQLARTLSRPSFNIVPPVLLKILYGEGARVVIRGVASIPEKLEKAGFRFKFEKLEPALKDLLVN